MCKSKLPPLFSGFPPAVGSGTFLFEGDDDVVSFSTLILGIILGVVFEVPLLSNDFLVPPEEDLLVFE